MKEQILTILSRRQQQATTIQQLEEEQNIQSQQELTALMRNLNAMADEGVIVEHWDHSYRLLEYSDCVKGTVRIHRNGYGFVDSDRGSIYIREADLHDALDQDMVLVQVHTYPDGMLAGEVLRILEHTRRYLVGNIRVRNRKPVFYPDESGIHQPVRIIDAAKHPLVDGHKVRLRIVRYGPVLSCRIDRILGHIHDPGIDILGILMEHDIIPEFPAEVMEQLLTLPQQLSEQDMEGHIDLRDRIIFTIDGEDAKDLDDAVSIEQRPDGSCRLGVHIADVSHYVKADTPLDREAYARSTSVYTVDRVVPMLPHALSNGICSLYPHQPRLTITCDILFDTDGNVTDYQLYPSLICSCERMTYRDVNAILAGDQTPIKRYQTIYESLLAMADLSAKIRKHREAAGAIDFEREEALIQVDQAGHVIGIQPRQRGLAERMIEDFMISANECVAKHMRWLEYPCLYRCHRKPPIKKMRAFVHTAALLGYTWKGSLQDVYPRQFQALLKAAKDTDVYPILSDQMLRSMSKAVYAPTCDGHFGLALDEYLHFTSPIRRYPDLIVHRMLHTYVFQSCMDFERMQADASRVEEYAVWTSAKERNAIEAQRAIDDMKKAEYMEAHIGDTYTGIISGLTNFGIFVELPNTVEGLVRLSEMPQDYFVYVADSMMVIGERTGKTYRLGQTVTVRCIGANRFHRTVDFMFVKKEK